MNKQQLVSRLMEIGVVKLGEYTLKSGVTSPIYIDLRIIISFPKIVKDLAGCIWAETMKNNLNADVICGVPYTALPIASVLSVEQDLPMVLKRKEAKNYGTKKMVEGIIKRGDRCLIIEDIVSSGSSVIETADILRQEGLIVTDCIVVIDRKQGGKQNLAEKGITLHSILDLESVISTLCTMNILSQDMEKKLKSYFLENSFIPITKQISVSLPFVERMNKATQPVSRKLFEIISKKETNLCVAVDTVNSNELLRLSEILGPHICMLKTHIDILEDFTGDVISKLCNLAEKHQFLVFEDRKFADIGNTVKQQYSSGVHKIIEWADVVTVHCFPGDGIVDALKSVSGLKPRSCVLIAQMSSKGALNSDDYIKKVSEIAGKNKDFVIGFISQTRISDDSDFIHMCPGVNLNDTGDSLGQQYKSPEVAIGENGADIIIVGRGITNAKDIVKTAEEYKCRAFKAYMNKTINNI